MYSTRGRPWIPPEHLLKSTLLMALYSTRSLRQYCERLQYDLPSRLPGVHLRQFALLIALHQAPVATDLQLRPRRTGR